MKLFTCLTVLALAAITSTATMAQNSPTSPRPYLSPMFTDNMVLQRGMSDPVWGWTTPGASVTVRIAGKEAQAIAGTDGKWTAKLPPLPVGGPYTMDVSGLQSASLHNVLVGDVWLCSGQSNMQFGIGNGNNAKQEIAAANYPQIRLFMAPTVVALSPRESMPVSDNDPAESHWNVCTPQTIAQGGWNGFTAVGYFFGRDLHQNLHVPIGLIESNVGGTPAEAWTSAPALEKMPDFQNAVAQVVAERDQPDSLSQLMGAWYQKNDPGQAGNWADPTYSDAGWETMTLPGYFQQAGLADLTGINGIVWFRQKFDIPAEASGKDLTLHFTADDNDTAWVNGTQVGATQGYQTPRAYTIPTALLKPTGNVIAVRVLDTGGFGGIYGASPTLTVNVPNGPSIPLDNLWHIKLGAALTQTSPLPQDPTNTNTPTVLYNGMINPLIPYGIKGALWYQGENNAGKAVQYATLLPTMINDWRGRWNEGTFPFLIVQLAGWQPGGSNWPELRQAQWLTAKDEPNAGIATAIDIGDAQNIHPTDKQDMGKRLALVAEAQVYHEKVASSGPVYKSISIHGNVAQVTFQHDDGGLVAHGGPALTGFEIAGADKKWVSADAKLDGNAVVVSAPQVDHPVAVRYAWSGFPACSLYNGAGLPAFPFQTNNQTLKTLTNG
jgi:sialate O-acetylesterase